MKPTIGRTVIVLNLHGSGSLPAPAIITRCWGSKDTSEEPQAVNLAVLPDCEPPLNKSSVMLFDSREAAERYLATMVGHSPTVAHWPDREPQVRAVAMPLAA